MKLNLKLEEMVQDWFLFDKRLIIYWTYVVEEYDLKYRKIL